VWAAPRPESFPPLLQPGAATRWPGVGEVTAEQYPEHIARILQLFGDLRLEVVDHAATADGVIIAWKAYATVGGQAREWSGVDRFVLRDGRVVEATAALPAPVQRAVDAVRARLDADPFGAPEAGELTAAGLGARELAAAVRDGQLVRIAEGIYLAPGIEDAARTRLAALPQPFTLSQARQAWGTSRRVAVPLAEWLDGRGVTQRLPDNTRRLR
jgi:hypothetical protein